MICTVHHGHIRGKVYRWNHRVMCGRCYRYFCRRVRVVRKPEPQPGGGGIVGLLRRLLQG